MFNQLKKLIPFQVKMEALLFLNKFKSLNSFSLKTPKQPNKRIFIFLAADYGNLGDVAITYAQHKFLQGKFPGYLVTEIPISKTIKGVAFVKKIVTKDDIITTVGGGNMGDLYPIIEHLRQLVISNFRNNLTISFPQTVDFKKTDSGKKALNRAVKIYSRHPNLILLAREQKTYDFFESNFIKNKIFLVPDIVLTLDKAAPKKGRNGVIVCLRKDKEKKLSQDQEQTLLSLLKTNFKNLRYRDTHVGGDNLALIIRIKALYAIWNDFKSAKIVITDRLHGMIFCYITNTPVIVFLNNNHKIQSSFKWIKSVNHIHLMENFSEEQINTSIKYLKDYESVEVKTSLTNLYDDFLQHIYDKI